MSSLVHRKVIFSLLSFHHQGMKDSHNNLMFKSLEEKLDFFKCSSFIILRFKDNFTRSKHVKQKQTLMNQEEHRCPPSWITTDGVSVNDVESGSVCNLVITQPSFINPWHCKHRLIPTFHCPKYSCIYPSLLGTDAVQTAEIFYKSKPKMIGFAPRHASKPSFVFEETYFLLHWGNFCT